MLGTETTRERKSHPMTMMKRLAALVLALAMLLTLAACGGEAADENDTQSGGPTLVYGSGDYTRINPAMDEHGEINVRLFDGLTDHDGQPFTADDVKFSPMESSWIPTTASRTPQTTRT